MSVMAPNPALEEIEDERRREPGRSQETADVLGARASAAALADVLPLQEADHIVPAAEAPEPV